MGGRGATPVVVKKKRRIAAAPEAEAAPAPLATPKEQWAALAAKTPGMPAWEALDAPQQARWTDMAHRDVANLAAAATITGNKPARIAGDNTIENDAEGRPLVTELTPAQTSLLLENSTRLEPAEQAALEAHYGEEKGTPGFMSRLSEDIVLAATKGLDAVDKAVRAIIGKLAKAVLSVAVVFNVAGLNPQFSSESYARVAASLPKTVTVTQQVQFRNDGKADLNGRQVSSNAQRVIDWIAAQNRPSDNSLIVDPATGRLYVMKGGKVVADAPALFGKQGIAEADARIINANVDETTDDMKVTPSGRYAARMEPDADYGSRITFLRGDAANASPYAIHRVYLGNPKDRRQQRLDSASPLDNTISYGCVNVSNEFYDQVLRKLDFSGDTFTYLMPSDPAKQATAIPTPDTNLRTTRTATYTESSAAAPARQGQDTVFAERRNAAGRRGSRGDRLNSGRPASDLNTALRTAVTKDEFAQVEGAAEAFADLEALGIGHATDWVDTWIVGAESTYHMRGRQQVVEILPAGSVDLNGNTRTADDVRFDVAHEVGHAVDIASNGSVYSSQPELEFMSFGGDIRPVGEVAVEIENAMQESVALRALMEYPYDTTKFPEVATPKRAQQELFAQLFGMYAHPLGRKHLARYAPQAYKFITEVVQDVQSTKVDPGHSRGTAIRRGAGFLARAAAPQKRNAPASAGVLGSGTEGKLGSRSTQAVAAFEREQSAVARVTENLRPRAKDATTNLRDWFKKHAPWALTSFQLAEQFGDKVAGLVRYIALTDAAKTERTRLQMIYRETAVVWDKLPTKVKERLNELMQRATLDEVHPDLEFEDDANKHLRRKDPEADAAMRAEYQVLADQYNALPQEARDVYQRAKKDLEDSWKKRAEAYRTLVSDTYHDELVKAIEAGDAARHEELTGIIDKALKEHDQMLSSIKGPYFPLMRFGEYLAIGESSEYLQAQKDWAEAEGDVRKEAAKKLDKLKRDGNHYVVSAHETRAAAERTLREYAAKGLTTRSGMAGLKLDQLRAVTQDTVRHMEDAVSKRLGGGLDTAATDALREVFLQGLPEMHALRREAARKGIEGASVDMLRAYTNAGQSNAFYTSRLMYAKDMADAMFEMKDKTKGNTDLTHVAREMEQRMALDLKFTETPLQDLASSVTWAYMLGVSPAYLAINTMQPFLVTAPVLAGKFGPAVTMREVGRAARDALRVLKATRWKDGKWDGWSGVNEESIPGPSRNEDRAAIRALLERGILDEGMHHELNMFAQGGSRLLAKANRYMSWATQQVEMTNRITTALAAFRLARKDGMTEEQATDFAYKTVNGTQFDYSPEGSARMMREGGGIMGAKLVFQFRRYQQNMLYLLGANIKKSFGEGQEAKDARATLVYLSIATGMTAGVTGLPFMGLALAVANALRDDDDEDGDAETALRNALFDLTGDRRLADILAKGAPAMFGMDLSKRVGLADVANPFPFARLDRAETGRDVGSELLFNLAGPSAGVGANFAEGVRLMAGGDFVKGVEKLVPKMFADPIKAARYATKGFTDSRGDEILGADELDAWDKAYRFLGFQPTVESNYYEGTKAKMGVKTAIEDRKGKIGNAFKVALRDGNMADVREMIREYNADHPTAKILPKDEIRWRKDALKARSQRDGSGVKFDPKRDRNYEEVMRFVR